MRVGSIVYATEQGLGYLAKNFFDVDLLTDVLIVRHKHRVTHYNWYPTGTRACDIHERARMGEFCARMDVMVFLETPFHWDLVDSCRSMGVRTVLVPMHECMPAVHPKCDITIAPSLLDQRCYPGSIFLPVPVEDSIRASWRLRTKAEVFVHNAGHGGLRGRNGTRELLEALQYVKSDARFIIRCQDAKYFSPRSMGDRMQYELAVPRDQLYAEGDVFLFPEKFNGLSLPMQEAYAAGMAVMGTHRDPMASWLPQSLLIEPSSYVDARIGPPYRTFQEAVLDPKRIAAKIDEWYGQDITRFSEAGKLWADSCSWRELRDAWRIAICKRP